MGRLLGREHASTPQSGVEAPRLLKRSLQRLYYCCCCFGHSFTRQVMHMSTRLYGLVVQGDLDGQQLLAIEGFENSAESWHSTSKRKECENAVKTTKKHLPSPPHERSSHVHADSTSGCEFDFTQKMREIRPKASKLTHPGRMIARYNGLFEKKTDFQVRTESRPQHSCAPSRRKPQ